MNIQFQETSGTKLYRDFDWSTPMSIALAQTPVVWQVTIDGELACLVGMVPPTIMSDRVYIWLYHTSLMESHKFILVRWSQRFIEKLLGHYSILCGHCHIDGSDEAAKSMRWLRWLGAEFGTVKGKRIPFQIRKKHG